MRTFFSLPRKYSSQIQKEIHQLIYYNHGGYSWSELYNKVPVHFRKFLLRETQRLKDKEAEEMKKARDKATNSREISSNEHLPPHVKNQMQKNRRNMPRGIPKTDNL